MEDLAVQLKIDIDRRTIRGRVCPRCGGKIIPSHRAVYQSAGDPNEIFPAWQCERCGYEEVVMRPVKAAKHGAKAAENKAATAQKTPSAVVAAGTGSSPVAVPDKPSASRAVPALKDRKGRALPPDVNRMVAEMNRGKEVENR